MCSIVNHLEPRFGPSLMEVPCRCHRTHHVVPTLNDLRGNATKTLDTIEQLVRLPEESAVIDVVTLDPCEWHGKLGARETVLAVHVRKQCAGGGFPAAPRAGSPDLIGIAGPTQTAVVGRNQIVAL